MRATWTWYKGGILRAITLAILVLSARTASAQYKTNVYLEAECPNTTVGAYGTKLTSTPSYSLPGYIKSQGNTTASTYNSSSADHAVYNFTANQNGYLQVFFRVNTNGNASNDSLYYRVNGSDWETVNNLSSLGTGWRWGAGTSIFAIGTGANTIEIANRETGLEIDKIALLNSGDGTPSGTGGSAYNCPTTLYFEAECPTTASGAYPFKQFIAKSGFSGAGYIYSNQNNTGSASSSTDVAIFPFDSGASTYTFYFRVDTNASANNDSWFYRVDSGAWTTMNNLSAVSGWRWIAGTATASLGIGRHTLEVRNREKGLNIDKIAFVPSGGTAPSGTGGNSVNCDPAQTMSGWGFWEQTDFAATHQRFFEDNGNGAMTIDMHVDWHHNNDPGGMNGKGSGVAFLGMHRAMMNAFRAFALAHGYRSWTPLDLTKPLPYAVSDAAGPLLAAGQSYYDTWYAPRTGDDLSDIGIPPYLTASGGPATGGWSSGFYFVDKGTGQRSQTYYKLADIPDLDTLGRIIGESQFHTSVHVRINGTMGDLASPSDPFFYGWHGLIDSIADNWLKTSTGRTWINNHPGHPFLDIGFTHMDGWDDSFWVTQPL